MIGRLEVLITALECTWCGLLWGRERSWRCIRSILRGGSSPMTLANWMKWPWPLRRRCIKLNNLQLKAGGCLALTDRRGQESHLRPPACVTGTLLLSYSPMGCLIGDGLGKLDSWP
jgi:hypothetical protein